MNEAWMDEFDETFKIVKQITSRGYLTRMGTSFQLIDIPELKQFIAQKLEAQASRLLIEITANCKATTEALMEEARKEARDGVLHTTAETIEMVIGTIALDQGWEETGDKYRKMYGLPMIYVKED